MRRQAGVPVPAWTVLECAPPRYESDSLEEGSGTWSSCNRSNFIKSNVCHEQRISEDAYHENCPLLVPLFFTASALHTTVDGEAVVLVQAFA